ncbi:MAG: 50S ribosomal protein L24 [Planctomycetota bacterium]
MSIRRGDFVEVVRGADQGKRGKVLSLLPDSTRLLVAGVRLVYKHMRPNRQNPRGGRVRKETSLDRSNVMLVCPHCEKPRRSRVQIQPDRSKTRLCVKCKKEIG